MRLTSASTRFGPMGDPDAQMNGPRRLFTRNRTCWSAAAMLAVMVAFRSMPGWAGAPGGTSAMHLAPEGIGSARTWVFGLAKRGDDLWAVGSFGIQVKRAKGSWTQVVATTKQIPLAIAFAPTGAGVVVGQEGAVWQTRDNSEQWANIDLGETQRLFAVAASPSGEFVAAGAFGTLWDRPAGQMEWHHVATKWAGFDGPHLYGALFVDDGHAIIVGERGTVIDLVRGEITGVAEHGEESLFAVTRCGESVVAAGQEGLVLVGGGGEWQGQHIDAKPDIFSLGCLGSNRVVAGSAGFLEVATAQGSSWNWQRWDPNPIRIGWYAAVLPANGEGLLLAGQGDIWRTRLVPHAASQRAE